MTCGIYLLRFEGTDKVYVGQSLNIEKRFTQHKNHMVLGTATPKMQEAFNIYGPPNTEVLVECVEKDLDVIEVEAIEIFDAVANGFNSSKGGHGGGHGLYGEQMYNASYSNEKIIEVFNLLIDDTSLKLIEVSVHTGVPKSIVSLVSSGASHLWLKDLYPIKYAEMLSLVGTRRGAKYRGGAYPSLVSPNGIEYCVDNISAFTLKHSLCKVHIGKVLKGTEVQYKGWHLISTVLPPKVTYTVEAPTGDVHTFTSIKEFAKANSLQSSHLSEVLNSKRKQHKGWKLHVA